MRPETRSERSERSAREELANVLTHGAGLAASAVAAPVLLLLALRTGDPLRAVAAAVYGASLVALYAASTLYHGADWMRRGGRGLREDAGPDRRTLRLLDHAAIFLLIAGTYTPVALVGLGGTWGWSLFLAAWGLAAVGIVAKVKYLGRFPVLGPVFYLFMGWIGVLALPPLQEALSSTALALLAAGGVAYTAGVIFYAWKRLPYGHAIWHLFVLAGSASHFGAVTLSVVPTAPAV